MWIVWNEARTEGFVTNDAQLAYEVRKSADTNCVTENGDPAPVAVAFCERWSQDNCTMEPIAPVNQVDTELALVNARGEMGRAYKRHAEELAAMRARLETREQELFQARDALHRLEKQRAADIERLQQRIDLLESQHRAAVVALGFADPDERRT